MDSKLMKKGHATKPHIGIFGKRNIGKSSLINLLAGQEIAIVSEIPGTTTDPVKKSIEIMGIGPVIMIDTAGIDDSGMLGEKRVARTRDIFSTIDLAIHIIAGNTFEEADQKLMEEFKTRAIPFFLVHNKCDLESLSPSLKTIIENKFNTLIIDANTRSPAMVGDIIRTIQETMPTTAWKKQTLIGDIISKGDVVLLITPIDSEAPEGRMILPQVQVIRDVLDYDGICVVCKEHELDTFIPRLSPKPVLAITDSQVFPRADAAVPKEILLTSFSIVFARQKGDFGAYLKGTPKISTLREGERILILESCTHQISCDDIGRFKIPRWLTNFTGKRLEFDVVAGLSRIERPINDYALVIQCGGCMITRRQLLNRIKTAIDAGIPVTNYGLVIAFVHGIYNRAIEPFTKGAEKRGTT
jgi:[FeFe] hydrogenase H-cluster maturation GTPase HydF